MSKGTVTSNAPPPERPGELIAGRLNPESRWEPGVQFSLTKKPESQTVWEYLTRSDIQNQPLLQIFGKLSFTSWKKGLKILTVY